MYGAERTAGSVHTVTEMASAIGVRARHQGLQYTRMKWILRLWAHDCWKYFTDHCTRRFACHVPLR